MLQELAEINGVTPTQIVLRWHVQIGSTPIPKSADAERQRENADVFGFELTADEVAAISALERGRLWGARPEHARGDVAPRPGAGGVRLELRAVVVGIFEADVLASPGLVRDEPADRDRERQDEADPQLAPDEAEQTPPTRMTTVPRSQPMRPLGQPVRGSDMTTA